MTTSSRRAWRRAGALLVSVSSAVTGLVVIAPTLVAKADVAQRTSWNAASHELYRLEGNNGSTWVPIDSSKLVLSVTPAVASTAVLSAFADVESSAILNTEVAIEVNNVPVVWKDGGEYTGSSPDPVYVQQPYSMSAGMTYVIELMWRSATSETSGEFLEAGDPVPPDGPGFSPTTLNALLTPSSDNLVAQTVSPGTGVNAFSTANTSWTLMDSSVEKTFVTPSGSSNFSTLFTASADLYSHSSAYANADMGICVAASGTINATCTAGASIIAAQTSGSASGAMPVAALVEGTQTLAPSTTYTMAIFWQSESLGNTIYGGAGSTGAWSLTSLIAQMTPVSDGELSTLATSGPQSRSYATGDDGTGWETLGSESYSITPTVNVLTYLTANATLATNGGTHPIDVGICVTVPTETCSSGGSFIVGETASQLVSPTTDAAYLQIPVFMTAGTSYTVTLEWRTGDAMILYQSMMAGRTLAGSVTAETTLTSLEVPDSAPSAPPSVSATAGNGQATVSWTASTLSPGSPLTGYAVTPYVQTAAGSTPLESMDVPPTSPFIVPNLANGQTYTFAVAGINAEGAGLTTSSTSVVPGLPGAPTGVTIGTRGDGFENLSWTAPSSSGASAITGSVVTPYIAGVAQVTTTVWGTGTSTAITGLTDGTAYTFGVAATNVFGTGSAGTSGSNNPHKVVPGAPTGVTGAPGNAQATINWIAPAATGGATITGYTITPYIGGTAQTTTSASTSPATVTGLTNGTTYTFTVAAVNSIGTGAASSNSWVVIPATTPVVPSMTVAVDKGSSATYAIGNAITYTATISSNAGAATTAAFTDALPPGVSGTGGLILVNGAACSGGTTCTATATTVSVSGLSIPATGNVVVSYALTVVGTLRNCALEADIASVTISSGNSVGAAMPFTACDSDLGTNAWNSFITQTLGDGGNAGVNPANGNLMVTQTDSMPMQLHGGLSFDLTRTYNSQDTDLAGVPNIVGAGWIVSFVDAGTDPAGIALVVPSVATVANPVPITLVDGSGARYVYTPTALSSVINVGSIATGVLATAVPNNLTKTTGYNQRCIDEEYNPPAGVHVAMWRYIETMGTCATLSTSTNLILGYATLGADRIRHEYNALGELINLNDAVGNQVNYTYNGSNQLIAVTEQGGSGRKFTIFYSTTTKITDAGGEKTTYTDTSGNLTTVANPDGTTLSYTYGGCTGASAAQLCSAKDGRGHPTDFTYIAAATGPAMVATIVDRNSDTSTITYNSTNVTSDRGVERTAYASIDASGRVGEVDAGSTSNAWLNRTFYGWDTASAGCRQPDAGVDNDLCSIVRRGLTAGAPDRVTDYTYGDEGQMLVQRDVDYPTDVYTTAGYQEEYFEAGVSVSTYTDTVAGSGNVTSTTQSGGRKDGGTLFDVITQTQALDPTGNAAGSGYGIYEATYVVDNNSAVSTNTVNGASTLCATPASPTANTGLVCQAQGQSYDGSNHPKTGYTYNPDGTRATMETPLETVNGWTTRYTYTYYQNSDLDLSGTTSAGGWLKGITDPSNYFTAFAYDAEGHQVRSWDRDATQAATGIALSSADWDSLSLAPAHYSETLYTDGMDNVAATFASPGRFVLASRTQMIDWTTDTVDQNGNVTGTQEPDGTVGSSMSMPICPQSTTLQTFYTCMTYDADDNLTSTLAPVEANESLAENGGTQHPTSYVYDAFNNRTSRTDPNGNVTVTNYDVVNRPIEQIWTMAVWGAMTTPNYCVESTSGDTPIPAGRILCKSYLAYDGTDNEISSIDGNNAASYDLYDADHRVAVSIVPSGVGAAIDNLVTTTLYDADGRVTDVCSPREQSEGSTDGYLCNVNAAYAQHTVYLPDGLVAQTSEYQVAGTRLATAYRYDADGNKSQITNALSVGVITTYTYSELDRLSQVSVPQTSTQTDVTGYTYDPSGDQSTEHQQTDSVGDVIRTVDLYDWDHRVVETDEGASSDSSTSLYSSAAGTDVRTRNVYDGDGNLIEQFQPNSFVGPAGSYGTPDADYAISAAYNADNKRVALYRPRYDTNSAHGAPLLTDPVGTTGTQESECATGGPAGYGYASTLGICTTRYTYDPDGNVAQVTWPTWTSTDTGPFTTYAYTDTNLPLTEQVPNPAYTTGVRVAAETYSYDADGRQVAATDADGIATDTTYTQNGRVATTSATPNGSITHTTSYLYDAAGNVVETTDAMGNSTSTSYLANGLTQSVTDAMGDVTKYQYDQVGNPTDIWSPDAVAESAANPAGLQTHNIYTENNLLEATLIPYENGTDTQRAVCYGYDEAGRKTGEGNWLNTGAAIFTEPASCNGGAPSGAFAFALLPDGRLATETGRGGSGTLSYTYDADGNQLTSVDSAATTTSTYYADDSLRTANDGESRTTSYAYDGAGQLTVRSSAQTSKTTYKDTLTYSDSDLESTETNSVSTGTTEWGYDASGRITLMDTANSDSVQYTYAADGTVDDEYVQNDIFPGDGVATLSQTLDGDYRVTSDGCSCENTTGTSVIGSTFTYQYDAASRVIFIDASGGAAAFQTYDPDGNRISHDDVTTDAYTSYTYNADNSIKTMYTAGSTMTATYDTNGGGVLINDGCVTWTLDTFDRATGLTKTTGAPTACAIAPTATTYAYDANGIRVSETVGSTTTTLHNDALANVPLVESTGATDTAYVLDANGTPIESMQGSTYVYPIDDPKGDATVIMEANGNWPVCTLQYDPYGTAVFTLSPSNQCENGSTFDDMLYQNDRLDSSSMDYQLGTRTYDPSKNSFLSPDGYQQGSSSQDLSIEVDPLTENAYTFVDGDPVNNFDPSGHVPYCGEPCDSVYPSPPPPVRCQGHTGDCGGGGSGGRGGGSGGNGGNGGGGPRSQGHQTPGGGEGSDPGSPQTQLTNFGNGISAALEAAQREQQCIGDVTDAFWGGNSYGTINCGALGQATYDSGTGALTFTTVRTNQTTTQLVCGWYTNCTAVGMTTIQSGGVGIGVVAASGAALAFFRGARDGGAPSFTLGLNDYAVRNGLVRGLSVSNSADDLLSRGFTPYQIDLSTVSDDLAIVQRGLNTAHFEIIPAEGTPPQEEFQALLDQIAIVDIGTEEASLGDDG